MSIQKQNNFSSKGWTLAVAIASCIGAQSAQSDQVDHNADTIGDAVRAGKATLNFRMRYEDVDQEGLAKEDAMTLKTRLTLKTGELYGFRALLELDNTTELRDVDYRTAGNDSDNPGTPVIADPEGSEVNQAYIAYAFGATTAKYGRQRILLDNQRFVGGVGWRQNEQTYDAFTVTDKSFSDLTLFYGYINNVNRIFGDDNAIGDHDNSTHLVNVKYEGLPIGAVSAYSYLIDNDDATAFSTATYGARLSGKFDAISYFDTISYAAEYATQSDAGDNPSSYDADYYLLEGGVEFKGVNVKLGYEVLGADGSDGQFITPLATLHKFQGWTDKFLGGGTGNLTGGIEDTYVSIGTKIAGVGLTAAYSNLSPDDEDAAGMNDLGSEFRLSIAKKFGDYKLALKYADYKADDFAVDTSKLWMTFQATF